MNTSQGRDALVIGSDKKPPVLCKDEYQLWVNRFKLFIMLKENGHLIWKSIEEGPTHIRTVVIDGKVVKKSITGFTPEKKSQYFPDI